MQILIFYSNDTEIEDAETRTNRIKNLIQQLPVTNFTLLKILVEHLRNVANQSQKNLMTVSNLSICFAPTLMRGPEENALSIMEIKYSNVVTNTLIDEYDSIFNEPPANQPQQNSYQSLPTNISHQPPPPQPMRYASSTTHVINNHDDHFGLGLPSIQYQNHQVPSLNSFPYYTNMNSSLNSFQYYPVNSNPNSYQYYPMSSSNKVPYRSNKVVTLYACVGDTESELSFGPNEIIIDGKYKQH